jgi:hypothetical protein
MLSQLTLKIYERVAQSHLSASISEFGYPFSDNTRDKEKRQEMYQTKHTNNKTSVCHVINS